MRRTGNEDGVQSRLYVTESTELSVPKGMRWISNGSACRSRNRDRDSHRRRHRRRRRRRCDRNDAAVYVVVPSSRGGYLVLRQSTVCRFARGPSSTTEGGHWWCDIDSIPVTSRSGVARGCAAPGVTPPSPAGPRPPPRVPPRSSPVHPLPAPIYPSFVSPRTRRPRRGRSGGRGLPQAGRRESAPPIASRCSPRPR